MADKLRAITEDPELRALKERYDAAPPDDREPILQAINEKADALYPGWRDTIERSRRDGVFLRNTAIHCVIAVRQREDLSEFERSKAKNAEVEFKSLFETARKSGFLTKEDAFALVEATQALTVAAGLEIEELRKLNEKFMFDRQRTLGNKPKKEGPRRAHARELTCEIVEGKPGVFKR